MRYVNIMKKNIGLILSILLAALLLSACSFGNQFDDTVVENTTGTETPASEVAAEEEVTEEDTPTPEAPAIVTVDEAKAACGEAGIKSYVATTGDFECNVIVVESDPAPIPTVPAPAEEPEVEDPAPAEDLEIEPSGNDDNVSGEACSITRVDLDAMLVEARQEASNNVEAVGLMVASLDVYFESLGLGNGECAWHEEGEPVPDKVVLWTNFHHSSDEAEVETYAVDGDYGVFLSTGAFDVPKPNSGGRYLFVIGDIADSDVAENPTGCMTATQFASLRRDADAFDTFFEDEGYAYGEQVKAGGKLDEGVFHGLLDEENSDGEVPLGPNYWFLPSGGMADQAGRWVPTCVGVEAN